VMSRFVRLCQVSSGYNSLIEVICGLLRLYQFSSVYVSLSKDNSG
jgi:hypothetical protein